MNLSAIVIIIDIAAIVAAAYAAYAAWRVHCIMREFNEYMNPHSLDANHVEATK